jgi:diguanylate cyclase (GGDEF)-like protein
MKILVIEDDEFDYKLVKRHLKRAFPDVDVEVAWMQEPDLAKICMKIAAFDICFIDHHLSDLSGIQLIRELCEAGAATPLVLLTGDETSELDQSAITAGAADFLHKDKLSVASLQRLTRFCLARKDQEKRLAEMAYVDPLTNLSNRAAFDKRCEVLLEKGRETRKSLAVILIDLDNFKGVNDTYGHPVGDQLLRSFSDELVSHFGPTDTVARLGGDEFGILLELNDQPQTDDSIRIWLRNSLKKEFLVSGLILRMDCSIGVCITQPSTGSVQTTDVLIIADRDLYSDKKLRRKLAFDRGALRKVILQSSIEQALGMAVERDEFEVVYQPKVNVGSSRILGFEALLRWQNSEFQIGPSQFIPIAEEFGIIDNIGAFALRTCCKQIQNWQSMGFEIHPVAVNVSPLQLENPCFAIFVSETLREFGIPPQLVEFELTEGAFGRRFDSVIEQMNAVSALGCQWVIDDFGVGFSSLSRIHKMPFSKLKIDKSFLVHLPGDMVARSIGNAIISMARTMNLGVVVEGVEDPKQLEGLALSDSDDVQGFHYYRPMPAAALSKVLSKARKSEVV